MNSIEMMKNDPSHSWTAIFNNASQSMFLLALMKQRVIQLKQPISPTNSYRKP